jgi:O-antigen/teichoic acid export membrane protein
MLKSTLDSWKQDRLLRSVVRNTGYLFSGSAINMALSFVQSMFALWLLGVEGRGQLATITVFASTINRLFSFRMGELVVRYVERFLAEKREDRAAAVVKAAALTEAVTSLLAFGLLALLSSWGAEFFSKDISFAPLYLVYGLIIPGNLMTETATGILQITRNYRSQAAINVAQSVLTALLIVGAYLAHADLTAVLMIYLLGKLILGIGPMVLAWQALGQRFGPGWWRVSFDLLPPSRELASFAIHTNLSATLNLLVRDSEALWISSLLSPYETGLYSAAQAIINPIMVPITPFISTTYPEISKAVAERAWPQLKRLLRRVTLIAGGFTVAVALGLLVFGNLLLTIYAKGPDLLPAYPILLVLLVGFGTANALFWNRSLLLALHQPGYPFRVTLVTGLAKVGLTLVLVPLFGVLAQAALLSAYLALSVGIITWKGLKEVGNAD